MPRVYVETHMGEKPTHAGWYSLVNSDGFPHRCHFDGKKWNDDLVVRTYSHWLKPVMVNSEVFASIMSKLVVPPANEEEYEFYYLVDGSDCPFAKKIRAFDMDSAKKQYDSWKAQQVVDIKELAHLPPKKVS